MQLQDEARTIDRNTKSLYNSESFVFSPYNLNLASNLFTFVHESKVNSSKFHFFLPNVFVYRTKIYERQVTLFFYFFFYKNIQIFYSSSDCLVLEIQLSPRKFITRKHKVQIILDLFFPPQNILHFCIGFSELKSFRCALTTGNVNVCTQF